MDGAIKKPGEKKQKKENNKSENMAKKFNQKERELKITGGKKYVIY